MSAEGIAYALGRCVFIFVGIGWSLFQWKKRPGERLPLLPIGVGVVATVLALLPYQANAEGRVKIQVMGAAPSIPDVITVDNLAAIERQAVKNQRSKIENYAPAQKMTLTAKASLIKVVSYNVLKLEFFLDGIPALLEFDGVVDGIEKIIRCEAPQPGKAFVYSGSSCESAVMTTFGQAR